MYSAIAQVFLIPFASWVIMLPVVGLLHSDPFSTWIIVMKLYISLMLIRKLKGVIYGRS